VIFPITESEAVHGKGMDQTNAEPIGEEPQSVQDPTAEHLDPLADNNAPDRESVSPHDTQTALVLQIEPGEEIFHPNTLRETWYSLSWPDGELYPSHVYIRSRYNPDDLYSLETSLVKYRGRLDHTHPSFFQKLDSACQPRPEVQSTLFRLIEVAVRGYGAEAYELKDSVLSPTLRPGFTPGRGLRGSRLVCASDLEFVVCASDLDFVARIGYDIELVRASPRRDSGPLEIGRLYVLKSANFMEEALALETEVHNYLKLRSLDITPSLVAILATTCETRAYGLVLEYCPGGDLSNRLDAPLDLKIRWARQLYQAVLKMMCAGVEHTDMKCQNVVITSDDQLRIIDLANNAVTADWAHPTQHGTHYCFGRTLVELFTGDPLTPIHELPPLPPGILYMIRKHTSGTSLHPDILQMICNFPFDGTLKHSEPVSRWTEDRIRDRGRASLTAAVELIDSEPST
jgi:hypothetical protein